MAPPIDYLDRYEVSDKEQRSILGGTSQAGITGFLGATLTDIAATLWNSLPLTPEVKTADILERMDAASSLDFYQENPDSVRAASFFLGVLIPGGATVKLLTRIRAGVKAAGFAEGFIGGSFAGERQRVLATDLQKIMRESGPHTAEYKSMVRQMYLSALTKETLDATIVEAGVLAAYNAHPWMEDYWKDPVQNFTLSVLFGAGLGTIIAVPGVRRQIIDLNGDIATQSHGGTREVWTRPDEASTNAVKFQVATANIKRYDTMAADVNELGVTREMSTTFSRQDAADRQRALIDAFPAFEEVSPAEQAAIVRLMGDPRIAIGGDKILKMDLNKIVTATPEQLRIEGTQGTTAIDQLIAQTLEKDPSTKTVPRNFIQADGKKAVVFFRLSTGEMFAPEGVANAAWAADIADAKKYITGAASKASYQPARAKTGFAEENLFRGVSSAERDAEYLIEIVGVQRLRKEQFAHVLVDQEDIARQNALLVFANKVPDYVRDKMRVQVSSEVSLMSRQRAYIKETVEPHTVPDYQNKVAGVTEDRLYRLSPSSLSKEASDLIGAYIHGGEFRGEVLTPEKAAGVLRRAFDVFHRGAKAIPGEQANARIAAEIWFAGKGYREELKKLADREGYLHLFRSARNAGEHTTVESFTVRDIAPEGGKTPELYKVHVDNVIGTIGSRNAEGAEIFVTTSHPQREGLVTIQTGINTKVSLPKPAAGQEEWDFLKLATHYADETERQMQLMISNKNFGVEEIAARTNSTADAVRAVMSGTHLKDLPAEWRRYVDYDKLDEYLNPVNSLWAVAGNPYRNHMAEAMANLDYRQLRAAHAELVEQYTLLAQSDIANRLVDIYGSKPMQIMLDRMLAKIGEINNVLVGDPRWSSADQVVRKLLEGPTFTFLGKEIIRALDKVKRDYLEPIAAAHLPLREKHTALIEYNKVVNKLASLQGWRDLVEHPTQPGKWTIVQSEKVGKDIKLTPVLNEDGSEYLIHQTEVIQALNSVRSLSGELYKMHNLIRRMTGQGPLQDLGFYLPPLHLVNKNIAYIIDNSGKVGVQLLVANNGPELESLMQAYKKANPDHQIIHKDVVTKGEQMEYNLAKGYTDYEAFTTYANPQFQHGGSSTLAMLPSDFRLVDNMLQGYENLILQTGRKYADIYLTDVTSWLDKLSAFYQRSVAGQAKFGAFQESTKDSARTLKNILLGRDQLEQSVGLKQVNTFYDFMINRAGMAVNNLTKAFGDKVGSLEYFEQLNTELKRTGVGEMFKTFNDYKASLQSEFKNLAPQVQSVGNGLMATLMLRMLDLSQAAVNIMSLPILTWATAMERMPRTALNATGDNSIAFPLRAMMDGIRHMHSPQGRAIEDTLWHPKDLLKQATRQYTDIVAQLNAPVHSKETMDQLIRLASRMQENKVVKDFLAKPADWAEEYTRRIAMHTGFLLAKQAHPGIDDLAATVAAVNFTDRAIGNYHAAQRPTVFQGTFGAAIGLFQTYFWTYAQSIYRGLENQNWKQLGTLALSQAGIFGISSWPGYHMLSEQIVGNFNDKHWDLTTGTYRAVPEGAAELILYGLPSSLGPTFYTRGDISPRIPTAPEQIAMYSGLRQGWDAAVTIAKAGLTGADSGTPIQSITEALSLQSLNRPIARWAELVAGESISRQHNTISPASEVWTPTGVFARLLGTRPLEEQVTRNARYLNDFYSTIDNDRRKSVMDKIRTAVRAGNLTNETLGEVALDYVRFGGDAQGWRRALNEVLVKSDDGLRKDLLKKLEPDSPINLLLREHF